MMKYIYSFAFTLVGGIALFSVVPAHAQQYYGNDSPLTGSVLGINGSTILIQSDGATIQIVISPSTQVLNSSSAPIGLSALNVGDQVQALCGYQVQNQCAAQSLSVLSPSYGYQGAYAYPQIYAAPYGYDYGTFGYGAYSLGATPYAISPIFIDRGFSRRGVRHRGGWVGERNSWHGRGEGWNGGHRGGGRAESWDRGGGREGGHRGGRR